MEPRRLQRARTAVPVVLRRRATPRALSRLGHHGWHGPQHHRDELRRAHRHRRHCRPRADDRRVVPDRVARRGTRRAGEGSPDRLAVRPLRRTSLKAAVARVDPPDSDSIAYYPECLFVGGFMRVAAVWSAMTVSVMALVGVPTAAVAASGGDISGVVTRADDATPLVDVCVQATEPTTHATGSGRTGADGTYALHVSAGSYQVVFVDCGGRDLVKQTWRGSSSGTSQSVNIADGSNVSNINAALQQGGAISGLVTDPAGSPVPGAFVSLDAPPSQGGRVIGDNILGTDSTGHYAFHGVSPGNVIVHFGPLTSGSLEFAGIFNGNVEDPTQAPVIVVGPRTAAAADAQLPRSATITGTVRDESGAPYAGACVSIPKGATDGFSDAGVRTSSDGTYTFSGLAPGDYRVQFLQCDGATTSQWYSGAPDQASATVLSLAEAQTVTGIDGVVTRGLHIAGTITDDNGNPLSTVIVSAMNAVTGAYTGNYAMTDGNGHYEIDGLRGIAYKIGTGAGGDHLDLVDRWYPGVPLQAAAAPILLAPGTSVDNADITLPHGATVSGTVTDSAGSPLGDVCVSLEPVTGGNGRGARTDGYGHYTVMGVDIGAYRVVFQPCNGANLAPTYWGGDDEAVNAQLISLALRDVRTGVDQVMQPGGTASSHVQDSAGNSLGGICVAAQRLVASLGTLGRALTDSSGNYRLVGLPAHEDYRLWFFACGSGQYVSVFNGDAYDLTAAPAISVRVGVEASGTDATMRRAGSISGSVTDQFGQRVYAVCVRAIDASRRLEMSGNATDNSGTFKVGGLPPGTYQLRFSDCGAWLATDVVSSSTYTVAEGVDTASGDTRVTVVTTPSAPLAVSATPGDGSAVVSWAPPADTGAAPITGYDVTANGKQVAHVVGGSRKVSISGLRNGTTYAFKVEAANRRGVGELSLGARATPRPASTLSETAPSSASWGSAVHTAGTLHDKRTGAALSGKVVELYARKYGATNWRLLSSVSTSSTGSYSFVRRLRATSVVRVLFPGDSTHVASSSSRLVKVRPTVAVAVSGHELVAAVSPHLVGATVWLQRSLAGSWKTVRIGTLNSRGRVTFSAARGLYRVVLLAVRGYLRATSRSAPVAG